MKKEYEFCLTIILTGIVIILFDKFGFHWFNNLTWVGILLMIMGLVGRYFCISYKEETHQNHIRFEETKEENIINEDKNLNKQQQDLAH